MKNNRKIILAILLLVLLVIVIIGYRQYEYYQSTHFQEATKIDLVLPTPLSSWIDYQNDYGWQLFYPPDWKVVSLPSLAKVGFVKLDPVYGQDCFKNNQGICSPMVIVSTYESLDNLKKAFNPTEKIGGKTLEEMARSLEITQTQNIIYAGVYEVDVANSKAFTLVESKIGQNDQPDNTIVLLENSGLYYTIKFQAVNAITQLTEEEQKILGGLKLLAPKKQKIEEPKLIVKNWEDYQNSFLGFSLKIPDDWKMREESDQISWADPNQAKINEFAQYYPPLFGANALSITVKIYPKIADFAKGFGLENDTSENLSAFLEKTKEQIKSTKKEINGQSAFEAITSGMAGGQLSYLLENQNSQIYEIIFYSHEEASSLSEIEKEILESFKML